jgi:hypothetical protein
VSTIPSPPATSPSAANSAITLAPADEVITHQGPVQTHEEHVHSLFWCAMDDGAIRIHQHATPVTVDLTFRHDRTEFVIDSGAQILVTPYLEALSNVHQSHLAITLADGRGCFAREQGELSDQ